MPTMLDYQPVIACEKPLYLNQEEVLALLDMCVTPLSSQAPDDREKEELVMRLVRHYHEFRNPSACPAGIE
jgi:hypothetical protein